MSERVQRMLSRCNAKTGQYKGVTGGGKREVIPADAWAAMAGADKLGQLLAKRIWMHDETGDAQIERLAYLKAVDIAIAEGWKVPKGREYVRHMTRLALRELIDPERCPACKGTCQEWDAAALRAKSCGVCGGTGRVRIDDSKRAKAVGMDKSRWSRVWRKRYETIHADLSARINAALRHAEKKLG